MNKKKEFNSGLQSKPQLGVIVLLVYPDSESISTSIPTTPGNSQACKGITIIIMIVTIINYM